MRFVRVFAINVAILLLFIVNAASGYASTTLHGCASLTPPSVSGSPVAPPATPGIVVINEILNNPASAWNCSEAAGTYSLSTDSWVEIYNPQNQPFNLYAAHTSLDDGPNTLAFRFPFGAAIAARGYLVVFPNTYSGMLKGGNNLRLIIGDTEIDRVNVPTLSSDTSYARTPDGSANWQISTNPSIDASNLSSNQVPSTPVSTKSSGSSGYTGTGSTGSGGPTPTLVTGKQPGWTKLQLPATSSSTPSTVNSLPVTLPATSATSSAGDMPRRILLTVLVVALALSLFWCWKLFAPR